MSAWLCSDIHLSAMIQSACVEGIIPFDEADTWWQQAKWQNLYALHCRYGDPLAVLPPGDTRWRDEVPKSELTPVDEPADVPVERTTVEAELDPAVIGKSIRCWGYQCMEFEGFDQTQVSILLLDRLHQHLRAKHPDLEAREDACGVWGIDSWDDVIAPRSSPAMRNP